MNIDQELASGNRSLDPPPPYASAAFDSVDNNKNEEREPPPSYSEASQGFNQTLNHEIPIPAPPPPVNVVYVQRQNLRSLPFRIVKGVLIIFYIMSSILILTKVPTLHAADSFIRRPRRVFEILRTTIDPRSSNFWLWSIYSSTSLPSGGLWKNLSEPSTDIPSTFGYLSRPFSSIPSSIRYSSPGFSSSPPLSLHTPFYWKRKPTEWGDSLSNSNLCWASANHEIPRPFVKLLTCLP